MTHELGKVEFDAPFVILQAQFAFFVMRQHAKQQKSVTGTTKQLFRRPELGA